MRYALLLLPCLVLSLAFPSLARGATFEAAPCWIETEGNPELLCGHLLVPEQRQDPASRQLRLPVVIFKGQKPAPNGPARVDQVEPLLFLNGGPGGSNWVYSGDFLALWTPFVKALQIPSSRDVIMFSQRGTDNVKADLVECPVFTEPEYYLGAAERPGQQSDWRANVRRGLAECLQVLKAADYPIDAYSSQANVADVKDLRAALGLDRLAIYGVSYGARLTVELARHDRQGLTRLILDSPSPPEADTTFRQVENLLAAIGQLEEICGRYKICRPYKFIERNLKRLTKRLDKRPREIRIRSQVTDGKARSLYLKVDSAVLMDILFFSFYFPDRILIIPKALNDAIANDFELVARLAGQAFFFDTGINYSTNTSVFCQDVPSARPLAAIHDEMRTFPEFRNFLENGLWLHQNLCPIWAPGVEIHEHKNPEPVAIPTLILSGGLDPVTPLPAARALLKSLPEAHIIFDPEVTHGTLPQSECVRDEVRDFLRDKPVSNKTC